MADVTRPPVSSRSRDQPDANADRAVSTILGYTLNLAVATLLVTGLLVAAGGFVEGQQERAIRTELDVVGSRVAGDLGAIDRLVRTGDDVSVSITVKTPTQSTGLPYLIAINESGNDEIVLTTDDPAVEVVVPFTTETAVAAETVSGGTFVVQYDAGTGTVVVENE